MTDYHAQWNTLRKGDLIYTAIDNKGPTTLTAGGYWHLNIGYGDSANQGALATAINTSIGATTHTVTCTFSATNLTYTFTSSPLANFTLNLPEPLAGLMGFASGALAAASSYTSTKRPLCVMRPLIAGISQVSGSYKQSGRMKTRVADDGISIYSVSPTTIPTYRDWIQRLESDTPLFNGGTYSGGSGHAVLDTDPVTGATNTTATMPLSWQGFWDFIRAEEFFAYASQTAPPTSATAAVYKMRETTAHFAPRRAMADYGLWDLAFNTVLIATQ